ncbi:hypothetical protein [Catenovulum maritimum]|uniref:Uncharacterized protein n=1 Tax=Catenovulum maritimum TaxID=1513271 RepID=A0A0J8GR79_9ALTE|nr:hypothetical protein [Catenovulum maritimum]KMT63724.1 hypothetical protein XM47_18050 [Catenovulum maritimum]
MDTENFVRCSRQKKAILFRKLELLRAEIDVHNEVAERVVVEHLNLTRARVEKILNQRRLVESNKKDRLIIYSEIKTNLHPYLRKKTAKEMNEKITIERPVSIELRCRIYHNGKTLRTAYLKKTEHNKKHYAADKIISMNAVVLPDVHKTDFIELVEFTNVLNAQADQLTRDLLYIEKSLESVDCYLNKYDIYTHASE